MNRRTRMMALLTLSVSMVAGTVAFAAPGHPLGPAEADVMDWVIDTYGGDIEIWYIYLPNSGEPDVYGGGNTEPDDPSVGGSHQTSGRGR